VGIGVIIQLVGHSCETAATARQRRQPDAGLILGSFPPKTEQSWRKYTRKGMPKDTLFRFCLFSLQNSPINVNEWLKK
jgi:hypothetical protein